MVVLLLPLTAIKMSAADKSEVEGEQDASGEPSSLREPTDLLDDTDRGEGRVSKVATATTDHCDHPSTQAGATTVETPWKQHPGQVAASWQASIDCEEVKDTHGSRPSSAKGRGHSHSPTSILPSAINFFSGNPSVETTEGIMHLYKQEKEEYVPTVLHSELLLAGSRAQFRVTCAQCTFEMNWFMDTPRSV